MTIEQHSHRWDSSTTNVVQVSQRWESGNARTQVYEVYTCYGRVRHGLEHCSQSPIKRQLIDQAVWEFVTETAVDLEATHRTVAEAHEAKLAETATLSAKAERDAATAEERLARVRRDYQDGKLDADDWSDQRAELTADLEAAEAQAQRFAEQRASLDAETNDVSAAVLADLTALRATIMGEAEAFRTALRRVFTGFELLPPGSLGVDTPLGGVIWPPDRDIKADGYVLVPHVRAEALNLDADEPLRELDAFSLPSRSVCVGALFGPIPVGGQ
jgi:hypothetical protein